MFNVKGLLLSFDIWTHVFDSIIILLCHCRKYVNKYTQTHSAVRDKILKHQHQLETCQKELKFQGFLFSGCIFETTEILLISYYSTPGIQQWHVSLKPHRVEYPIIHPRWNSRFGYTLYWVQTRLWCCVVTDCHNRNVQMYLLFTIICTMWRLENTIPLSTHHNAAQWHGAGGDNLAR